MPDNYEEFYRIQKLPPYVFAVLNEMRAKARAAQIDVIDLGMGNPDGDTPRVMVKKLIEAARNPRNHRYSNRAASRLREEIRALQANYGVDLDPDKEAIVTIGAKDALAHLLFAIWARATPSSRRIPLIPSTSMASFWPKATPACCPCRTPPTFLNRLEALVPHLVAQAQIDSDFVSAQPHHHLRRPAISSAKSCAWRPYGTMIIHDFAYADLGFDGYKPPSILQVEGAKEVAVEIFSMSKSYNMAGWRVGFCLGNRKMIAALARIKSYLDYGVFQPIQIASIIGLRECEEDTQKICAIYQQRRDVLVNGLNARAGR